VPLSPYITLGDLRAYLGDRDTLTDLEATGAISSASSMIERYTGRDFGPGTRVEAWAATGSTAYFPRATPIASLIYLFVDGAAVAGRIAVGRTAICREDKLPFTGEVEVTYSTLVAVPDDVKLATCITAQAILDSPAMDKNLTAMPGSMGGAYDGPGPGALPRSARSILDPLIRWSP
jgi:hypothetical protein